MSAERWWCRADLFDRYCRDVIAAELRRQRPQHDLVVRPVLASTQLGEAGLALDSLERMRIAEAVCEALRIPPGREPERLVELDTVGALTECVRAVLQARMPAPVFHSSGSQGLRRRVVHPWPDLVTELDYWQQRFGGAARVVSLVPSQHIYGFLFTLALPAMLGVDVLCARNQMPGSVIGQLQPGDLVIGHPMFWTMATGRQWPGRVTVVSSGGPVDRAAFRQVVSDGAMDAVEVYGATETAGIAERRAEDHAFSLLPWWSRRGDALLSVAGTNASIPDAVEWHGDRRLSVVRRKDGQVQIAGTNVSPERVASVLSAHPRVKHAKVRLMTEREGDRLKAFIVPLGRDDDLPHELEKWCTDRLSPPERPKAFTLGVCLPTGAEGKDVDWAIT